MKKSNKKAKLNPEEIMSDIDNVMSLITELENSNLGKKHLDRILKKAQNIEKNLKKKYPEDLDSKE
tara:strand:- start:472 stop:669 length:198 start_codon:yes stop_codon:yes gene_type:complete